MLKKILAVLAGIGAALSALFFVLFKKEKDENKMRENENNEIKNNLYAVTEAEKIVNEVRKENAKKLEKIKNSPDNLDSFNAVNECLSKQ